MDKWNWEFCFYVYCKYNVNCKYNLSRKRNTINFIMSYLTVSLSLQEWDEAIKEWYEEVKDMPSSIVASFASPISSGKDIGHYTQVSFSHILV